MELLVRWKDFNLPPPTPPHHHQKRMHFLNTVQWTLKREINEAVKH
jgi:hypothetical protein